MKTKQILTVFLLGITLFANAQESARKGWDAPPPKGHLSFGFTSTMPSTSSKDAYLTNSSVVSLDYSLPLTGFRKGWDGKGNWFGINIGGTYNFGGNGNPSVALPNAFPIFGQTSSSVTYRGTDPRNPGFRIGAGPQVNFNLGDKFTISPMVLGEYFSMTQKELSAVQTTQIGDQTKEYNLMTLPETKTSGLAITPKVRIQYLLTKNLGFFADASYIFGPKVNTQTSSLLPIGKANAAGQYDQQQLDSGTQVKGETKSNSYSALGFNVGLSFAFGGHKKTGDADIDKLKDNVKPKDTVDTEVENEGKDIFTYTHIKKDAPKKQNCLQVLMPSNGSTQNIDNPVKVLINNDDVNNAGIIDIKIYKISNDKNYYSKKENFSELANTQDTSVLSVNFDKEAKETKFESISIEGKYSGAVIEALIPKGKLSEGSYKMIVKSGCGVIVSNFMVKSSALTTISLTTDCKEKFGDYSYTFKIQNTGSNPILVTSIPIFTSSTGVITNFSISPAIPQTIPAGAIQNFTGSFSYSGTYTGDVYASVSGHQVGNTFLTSQDTEMGELKSCICNFCEQSADFDSNKTPNATYNIAGNSLSIHQDWWDMNPATYSTIVAAKAEIISFSREVSDECMKCDKDSKQWGNFISGKSGSSIGSFGDANGPVSVNTHHTLYFANPNTYSFDTSISLPPLSTLECCCEVIKVKIRYTYTYKDKEGVCKMCSQVFEYSYQRGSCKVKPDKPYEDYRDALSNPKKILKK